jgi:hypothetical protein
MLTVDDSHVYAADATGKQLGILVTAYPGRVVREAQLMSDDHTIWYVTAPNGYPAKYNCTDVVRLDLATNTRTVIAHAQRFSASADGSRVALTSEVPNRICYGTHANLMERSVVRDVATGAESTINDMQYWNLTLSPDGRTLVTTNCTSDDTGCHYPLMSAELPAKLGPTITLKTVSDPKISYLSLMPRADGLYALVDKQPQSCGCGGRPERYDRDLSVRRLSWTDLSGVGTTLYTVQGPRYFDTIVPTDGGVLAAGAEDVKQPNRLLYLIAGGSARILRKLPAENPSIDNYFPMP